MKRVIMKEVVSMVFDVVVIATEFQKLYEFL